MDLTGHDNIIFTCNDQNKLLLDMLLAYDNAYKIDSLDIQYSNTSLSIHGDIRDIITYTDEFLSNIGLDDVGAYIFLDSGSRDQFENYGYSVTASGRGPFAVLIRKRNSIQYLLNKVWECNNDGSGLRTDMLPYNAWLSSKTITEVTLVTPGDPKTTPFSLEILEIALRCCRQGIVDTNISLPHSDTSACATIAVPFIDKTIISDHVNSVGYDSSKYRDLIKSGYGETCEILIRSKYNRNRYLALQAVQCDANHFVIISANPWSDFYPVKQGEIVKCTLTVFNDNIAHWCRVEIA